MIIIHGDNVQSSYKRFSQIRDEYLKKGYLVSSFTPSELDPTKFRQALEPKDLFGTPSLIVINNLFSGVVSKAKKTLLEVLEDQQEKDLLIYQDKEISKSNLSKFPKAKIEIFKLPDLIFDFLGAIVPNNSSSILLKYGSLDEDTKNPEYLLVMINRQIRNLIQVKTCPGSVKLPGFVKQKLSSQAQKFTLDQLLDFHHQLFNIDIKVKTGEGSFDTKTYLENLLSNF